MSAKEKQELQEEEGDGVAGRQGSLGSLARLHGATLLVRYRD